MSALKIRRINKNKYLVVEGKSILRVCKSFKEAQNALISEDVIALDNLDDFIDSNFEDIDFLDSYREVA